MITALSFNRYATSNSGNAPRHRTRRSIAILGVFEKQRFGQNQGTQRASENISKPDLYAALFSPQFRGRMSDISRLNSGTLEISQGIGFIDNAIKAFDKKNLIPGAKSNRIGVNFGSLKTNASLPLIKKIEKAGIQRDFLKSETELPTFNNIPVASLGSNTQIPSKRRYPLEGSGLFSKGGYHANRESSRGLFDTEHKGSKATSIPANVPSGRYQYDVHMNDLFPERFPASVDYGSAPLHNPETAKKQEVNSTSFSNIDDAHIKIPKPSKVDSQEDEVSFEHQRLTYKDSHVIHPPESPSEYPSYPVYEDAHVTSDMKVLGTLLRNLHATEEKAQSLLDRGLK